MQTYVSLSPPLCERNKREKTRTNSDSGTPPPNHNFPSVFINQSGEEDRQLFTAVNHAVFVIMLSFGTLRTQTFPLQGS